MVSLFTIIRKLQNLPRNSPNFFPIPTRFAAYPTRLESPFPATLRHQTWSRPTCRELAVLPLPFIAGDAHRKALIKAAPFWPKTHRSPSSIPATSTRNTCRVLLHSIPTFDPWWWLAPIWPVHGDQNRSTPRGDFRSVSFRALFPTIHSDPG